MTVDNRQFCHTYANETARTPRPSPWACTGQWLPAWRLWCAGWGVKDSVVFAGGAARSGCLKRLLGDKLGVDITVPGQPQLVGALGAALMAGKP